MPLKEGKDRREPEKGRRDKRRKEEREEAEKSMKGKSTQELGAQEAAFLKKTTPIQLKNHIQREKTGYIQNNETQNYI